MVQEHIQYICDLMFLLNFTTLVKYLISILTIHCHFLIMNCNMNYKYFKGLNCKQVNVQSFHENLGNNFYYKVETDKLSTVTQGLPNF